MAPDRRPFSGAHEHSLAGGGDLGEAVNGAALASGALLLDQGLDMGGGLDLRPLSWLRR